MSQESGQSEDQQDAFPNANKYSKVFAQPNPQPLLIKDEKYSDLSDEDFEYNMRHKWVNK